MEQIIEFFKNLYAQYVTFVKGIFPGLYGNEWLLLAGVGVLILVIIAICRAVGHGKKIIFIAEGRRYAVTKSKKNKAKPRLIGSDHVARGRGWGMSEMGKGG